MKKSILLFFLLGFLVSCGPHRMSCGARGICDAPSAELVKVKS